MLATVSEAFLGAICAGVWLIVLMFVTSDPLRPKWDRIREHKDRMKAMRNGR